MLIFIFSLVSVFLFVDICYLQGLADAFAKMRFPFESPEACKLNADVFETMYYAGMEASCELAQVEGTYSSYAGSPVSKGILQPDMWGVTPSDRWDWPALRAKIAQHGVRNSLLLAPMPTASTAQVLRTMQFTVVFIVALALTFPSFLPRSLFIA